MKHLIGIVDVDLVSQTARNLSTQAVCSNMPRSRGEVVYVNDIGPHGVIVQIGGNQQNVTTTTGITSPGIENLVSQSLKLQDLSTMADRCGQLPMDEIDIFDVAPYYKASILDGTRYEQRTSGDTPDPRIEFCRILASASDGTSHNV